MRTDASREGLTDAIFAIMNEPDNLDAVLDALRMIQEHSRYFTDSELRQLAEDALLTYKGHFIHDPDEY